MDELEKCMAGEYYECHDEVFLEFKGTARRLLAQYHALAYEQKKEKTEILRKLFGGMGTNVSVGVPFICDYGRNIYVGSNVSVNMNCTFVDCNRIDIGSNVLIASNVQLYTATHPVELSQRLTPDWNPESGEYFCRTYARPIKIGERLLAGRRSDHPSRRNYWGRLCHRRRKRGNQGHSSQFPGSGESLPGNPQNK